jgi:mannose-6-phosphate isomerase-like protein (cupin superfamily)
MATATPVAPARRRVWLLGDLYTILVTGAESGGAYAMAESLTRPDSGPPPYIHLREDADFYIIEGELSVTVAGRTILATAGDFLHVPKGTVHSYRNTGKTHARHLVILTPPGFEEFFLRLGRPASDPPVELAPDPKEFERLLELAPKYNLKFVA